MLECRGISVSYGRHQALADVALQVAPGEITAILGANGAGKTTLLNTIAGLVPGAGDVALDGRSLRGLPPHLIVEAGVALVPEGRRIFGDLSVMENLLLGAYAKRARAFEREGLDRIFALFPKLDERRRQLARTMSGGEQQMVAIARAMMSSPRILMLDEPSLGLSPLLCAELFRALVQVRKTGVGILLVEQNARQALAIADRGYLLENGRIVGADLAANLMQDAAVQRAYLGGAAAVSAAAPVPGAGLPQQPEQLPAAASSVRSAPPQAFAPRPAPEIDLLIDGSLDALVRNAADIQTEHVRTVRDARLVRKSPGGAAAGAGSRPAPRVRAAARAADASLLEAIAKIEAAAQAAARHGKR
ncbi:MAG: ABC transporter ATP-binding protein [Betaproteobacteria bacterium]|nr:ABC transporter ATP-binding protein [Betaproteobacteria bacterium]